MALSRTGVIYFLMMIVLIAPGFAWTQHEEPAPQTERSVAAGNEGYEGGPEARLVMVRALLARKRATASLVDRFAAWLPGFHPKSGVAAELADLARMEGQLHREVLKGEGKSKFGIFWGRHGRTLTRVAAVLAALGLGGYTIKKARDARNGRVRRDAECVSNGCLPVYQKATGQKLARLKKAKEWVKSKFFYGSSESTSTSPLPVPAAFTGDPATAFRREKATRKRKAGKLRGGHSVQVKNLGERTQQPIRLREALFTA